MQEKQWFYVIFTSMIKVIKYMTNLKRLPILVLLLAFGVFLASSISKPASIAPGKYEKILRNITEMLKEGHYSPKAIDNEFSKKIFSRYIENLDNNKNIFLKNSLSIALGL